MHENNATMNAIPQMNLRQREEQQWAAKKAASDQCQAGQAIGYLPPSLREEAEKASYYHSEQAARAMASADFLREHPEFDEFVRLVRSGAIQF